MIDRAGFAASLTSSLARTGLSFSEVARRAQAHLPEGSRISAKSVAAYARAGAAPRRMSHVEALGKVLGFDPQELVTVSDGETRDRERSTTWVGADDSEIRVVELADGRALIRASLVVQWPAAIEMLNLIIDKAQGATTEE